MFLLNGTWARLMKQLLEWIVMASVLACICGPGTGCATIGHSVGKGIDGPISECENSVTAKQEIDSSGEEPQTRFRFETGSLATLLKQVSSDDDGFILRAVSKPGLGFADSVWITYAEIITTYIGGSFSAKTLTLDILLAAELPPSLPQRYGLLPGEQSKLQLKEKSLALLKMAHNQGTSLKLGENHVVHNTSKQERVSHSLWWTHDHCWKREGHHWAGSGVAHETHCESSVSPSGR
jgi:hypothetical protein